MYGVDFRAVHLFVKSMGREENMVAVFLPCFFIYKFAYGPMGC
jgi:hypothetical protein